MDEELQDNPVTVGMLDTTMKVLYSKDIDFLTYAVRKLSARIGALERRVKELETPNAYPLYLYNGDDGSITPITESGESKAE